MIIPDKVIICGVPITVRTIDHTFLDNDALSGYYSPQFKEIILCRGSFTVVDGKLKRVDYSSEDIMNTFYHELFHAVCASLGFFGDEKGSPNTEANAWAFSNIAMANGETGAISKAFEEWKNIVTDNSNQNLRKLRYVFKNTTFKFSTLGIVGDWYDYEMVSKRLTELVKLENISDAEQMEKEIVAKILGKHNHMIYDISSP